MDRNKLAKAVTRAGVLLIENGAEVTRVEDTMYRICKAYNASTIDSYATPTLLIISFSFDDDNQLYHNIKRVHMKGINLEKIDQVNTLSRRIVNEHLSLEEFDKELRSIDNKDAYNAFIQCVGAAICCFGFGLFFNGRILDAICATIVGILVKIILTLFERLNFGTFIRYLLSGGILTLLSIISTVLLSSDRDIVIISSIMLLVPGLAITNAIRDSINGDVVSGLARATEAIFIAVAIAVGSGLVFSFIGG